MTSWATAQNKMTKKSEATPSSAEDGDDRAMRASQVGPR